ncbi:MAG: hypothetical protein E7562_05780 [Ruminococcaceae bacterium]|nr:hypothetical protein [Oscillospiraceae bacterium]
MKIKKILSVVAALAVVLCVCLSVSAEENTTVFVSIADGDIKLCNKSVTVTDIDNDGKLTINDALYIAHEQYYEGGAAAGYESADSAFGLSLAKLWGNDNGSYGYTLDNASVLTSLAQTVVSGNRIYAYCYTDLTAWSDAYSYFDKNEVSAKQGESIELTLLKHAYDSNWNTISVPAENAEIYINGNPSGVKTDSNGKAVVTLNSSGEVVITAKSRDYILVPPVCVANVEAEQKEEIKQDEQTESPKTGDNIGKEVWLCVIFMAAVCVCVKRVYEK